MTVPSRGEDALGRSQRPPLGGRALPRAQDARYDPVAKPISLGPEPPAQQKKQVRRVGRVSPPPAVAARRPGGPGSPPPALFVTARLPVCRLPTPAHFPGGEAEEGPEFLGDSLARSAPPPTPPNPALGLGTHRGRRLAPEGAAQPSGLRTVGAAGPSKLESALAHPGGPMGAAAGRELNFRPCRVEHPPGLDH